MRKSVRRLLMLGGLALLSAISHAEPFQGEEIEVELVSESTNVVPGQTLSLALRLTPTEHWHT